MKLVLPITIVVLLTVVYLTPARAQTITIDQIVANGNISGEVRGLPSADFGSYKVIVYVHTDQWYIHPYAGQGEGNSWATVQSGQWRIKTVQRDSRADKLAALLVSRNYPEPNRLENLDAIPHRARVIRELRGTADFGKL
jgi:hypothetical protein